MAHRTLDGRQSMSPAWVPGAGPGRESPKGPVMHNQLLSHHDFMRLRQFDTCTLSNAIEKLRIRPRNEGFATGETVCRFPSLAPVLGYAATGKMKAADQPVTGRCYHQHTDWWRYVDSLPKPRIVVIEDVDRPAGVGALFGEVHARICQALDCVAYVTNGAVRDLPGVERLGFQLFSGSLSVSHAYAHIVEFGAPVEIAGLRIASGDLLQGDSNGVLSIPAAVAGKLAETAQQILEDEQQLFSLCEEGDFSVEKLIDALDHGTFRRAATKGR